MFQRASRAIVVTSMGFMTPKITACSPIHQGPAVFRANQSSGGVQPNAPAIPHAQKPQTAAPGVYRPDFSVAQRKAPPIYQPGVGAVQPKAPAVYRPGAAVSQRKAPPIYQPKVSAVQPKAPPVYRPAGAMTQRKAPPVYHPKISALQRKAPMVYRPGAAVSQRKAPPVYRPSASTTQLKAPYQPTVLAANQGYSSVPCGQNFGLRREAPPVFRPNASPPAQPQVSITSGQSVINAPLLPAMPQPAAKTFPVTGMSPLRFNQGSALQRATVTLRYTGESNESYADIISDAVKFHDAFGTGILYDAENQEVLATKEAEEDTHVDVFAHGNSQQVGDYNPTSLREFLEENKGTLNITALESIKLHSCDSNAAQDDEEEDTRPFAQKLFEEYLEDNQFVEIEGFAGHAVTDSAGRSRILKNPGQEKNYRRDMKPRVGVAFNAQTVENQYLENAGTGLGSYGYAEAQEFLYGRVNFDVYTLSGKKALRDNLKDRREWFAEQLREEEVIEIPQGGYHHHVKTI